MPSTLFAEIIGFTGKAVFNLLLPVQFAVRQAAKIKDIFSVADFSRYHLTAKRILICSPGKATCGMKYTLSLFPPTYHDRLEVPCIIFSKSASGGTR